MSEIHPAARAVLERILGVDIVIVDETGNELSERRRVKRIHIDGTNNGPLDFNQMKTGTAWGVKIIGGMAEGAYKVHFSANMTMPGQTVTLHSLTFMPGK